MNKLNLAEMLKNYEQTLTTLGFSIRKDWAKELLFARRMIGNATKISYISKSKIKGLEENVEGFKLDANCSEQRKKYFSAERPNKFFNRIVDTSDNYNSTLLGYISEQFNQTFLSNIKSKFKFFKGEEIANAYHNNSGICGCMSGKSKESFLPYAQTEGLKLATLVDEEGTILIRALLWYCKTSKKYFLDNSYEQKNINGDENLRRTYQGNLLKEVDTETADLILTGIWEMPEEYEQHGVIIGHA